MADPASKSATKLATNDRIIVVGGHTRSIGKTQLVCDIISALPEANWIAGKITQYGHGVCAQNGYDCDCAPDEHVCAISWERDANTGTDSSRFLAAGARRSFLAPHQAGLSRRRHAPFPIRSRRDLARSNRRQSRFRRPCGQRDPRKQHAPPIPQARPVPHGPASRQIRLQRLRQTPIQPRSRLRPPRTAAIKYGRERRDRVMGQNPTPTSERQTPIPPARIRSPAPTSVGNCAQSCMYPSQISEHQSLNITASKVIDRVS